MISADDQALIFGVIEGVEGRLGLHFQPGFGITPSSHPNDNYHAQVWARDFAHAAGNYFAHVRPEAVAHSLERILRYQRADDMLPYRVEREYEFLKFLPGLQYFTKSAFVLIENKLRHRSERPVYEREGFGGGEDTVPAVIIAVGEFWKKSAQGKEFAKEHYTQLQNAVNFFRRKADPQDGLAIIKNHNADWVDTVKRKGKLAGINILWAEALAAIAEIARSLGREGDARQYVEEFERVRASIMGKMYAPEGYFKASPDDDRLDTTACIFGAMYLLDVNEAVRVEEALRKRVARDGVREF
jgi:hypothetical protein